MAHLPPGSSRRALFVILFGSLLAVAIVLRPLAISLFLAGVLGTALWPLEQRLTRILWGRKNLAAGILILLLLALIVAPITALTVFVVRQGIEAVNFISNTVAASGIDGLIDRLPRSLANALRSILGPVDAGAARDLAKRLQEGFTGLTAQAAAGVAALLTATGRLAFQWAMMLIALFFFLTNKEAILRWIDDASPLGEEQTHELIREFRGMTAAILRSTILTALLQSVVAVIGYYIVSLPAPAFFGALTFVFALVPAIGAASVCVLAALLLLLSGHPVSALFLALWGVVVVGLVDNLVKPWLIKGEVQMHGAVVFFALLGGLASLGAVGLLVGPLAVALFLALLRIYRRDYGNGVAATSSGVV